MENMPRIEPLFHVDTPSEDDISNFHRDGYLVYPNVFTDKAREGLIDAPLITSLLQTIIGSQYHFCHSALKLTGQGSRAIPLHQDHHHWFHENKINLKEREKYYIQILYYPNGFKQGDSHLFVVPGSHLIFPLKEVTPERLLSGEFDKKTGRALKENHLEVPPGSMIFINARIFHGVGPKPMDSSQKYRIFNIDIFKEAGPPHRHTQKIPTRWVESATPERKKLFQREPYTPNCWIN